MSLRLAIVLLLTLAGCASTTPVEPAPLKPSPAGCHFGGSGLFVTPDRSCTPGQWIDNGSGVCAKGYNPRPPLTATARLKRQAMKEYGVADAGSVESDHLFPVWLGGATVLQNLWPELNYATPLDSYTHNPKDALEFAIYKKVCQSHSMGVADARKVFEGSWVDAYHRYVAP